MALESVRLGSGTHSPPRLGLDSPWRSPITGFLSSCKLSYIVLTQQYLYGEPQCGIKTGSSLGNYFGAERLAKPPVEEWRKIKKVSKGETLKNKKQRLKPLQSDVFEVLVKSLRRSRRLCNCHISIRADQVRCISLQPGSLILPVPGESM